MVNNTNYSDTKVAVIGLGGWGKNHVRVLKEMGCLTAICDQDKERLSQYSSRYEIKNSYQTVDELLSSEKLDACLVCTPTKTHFQVASKIIEKSINVFVEKPLSYSVKECEDLVNAAQQNKVILTTGYIERFNPAVNEVKKIIKNKTHGDLFMMEFHRENRMPFHIKDVGIIYDTTVHDIDTAMHLFDMSPIMVFAKAGKLFHDHEDFATIILGFQDQKIAVISSNWITPKKVRRFSAICTNGVINGDFITQEITIDSAETTVIPRHERVEPLTLELKCFLDTIRNSPDLDAKIVTPKESINVTKVAEAALLSNYTGAPIYLEME